MADINVLVPLILKWEGGFVNDPDDLGGATNMGVTLATYRQYRKSRNLPAPTVDDLKNLSREEWTDILKTYYWDRWQADRIRDQSVANILVDWVWASGAYGIRIPQQILDVSNHSIFRHDNFIGCFSADKIKKSVRKYFCFNITIYKNMAEELSCRKPFPKEYIQTSASGNPEDLYH